MTPVEKSKVAMDWWDSCKQGNKGGEINILRPLGTKSFLDYIKSTVGKDQYYDYTSSICHALQYHAGNPNAFSSDEEYLQFMDALTESEEIFRGPEFPNNEPTWKEFGLKTLRERGSRDGKAAGISEEMVQGSGTDDTTQDSAATKPTNPQSYLENIPAGYSDEGKAVQINATKKSVNIAATQQITVPIEQWKALNDTREEGDRNWKENLLAQVQQIETTLRKEIQETQNYFQRELENMRRELQQTKKERDDLKKQIVAMKERLEEFRNGTEVLIDRTTSDPAKVEQSLTVVEPSSNKRPLSGTDEVISFQYELEEPAIGDRPKKISRTESKHGLGGYLSEFGKIPVTFVSRVQWPRWYSSNKRVGPNCKR